MLYMIGLEPYRERYTTQLDGPNGWWDRNLKRAGVEYQRIVPDNDEVEHYTLNSGVVLDPMYRTDWAFSQVQKLIRQAINGKITDNDVLYFSDIWHPGFEQLPYTFHQLGVKPRGYAFCHAQSVDEFDFTYPMRGWMRHFERGIAGVLDGVFVSCPSMKRALVEGGVCGPEKIHACGHVWSTEEVMERMPIQHRSLRMDDSFGTYQRKNQVVFSSRWDKEKNPDFFLAVADHVTAQMPEAHFVVCTSSPKLRSNDPALIRLAANSLDLVEFRVNLTKEEYYATLCESKVQFSCSDQDWVSYVLLEASAAGCYPIYPNFRSFPETLFRRPEFLYRHKDVAAAAAHVLAILQCDNLWSPSRIEERSWIHRRFDSTWLRMLHVMGFYPSSLSGEDAKDPFNSEDW